MKNRIFLLIFVFIFFQSFASAFLVSDQGTDVKEIATGNLTALANLSISIYDASTGGNLIFEENFTNGIANGSWNVMIDPDLDYGISYWKDYKINDEDLDFDGNERLEFQSAVGKINNISFVNLSLIDSCPAGSSIRLVYENGSVECETDDSSGTPDLTDYALKNQSETFEGNITTSQTGFFGWIGSLISRINGLFVQDIDFNGTISGSGNITTTGNVTADYFMGNGSLLTGISTSSYDDAWINGTIYNTTDVDEINTSMKNYVDWVNTTNTGGTDTDTFVANYSQFLENNESLTNYIESNNISIENYILYVNSTNGDGGTDTFVANYSQFLLNNESLTNYIESNNQSIESYILYVNSTNTGGAYDDSWINDTVDNKILVQNNSITNTLGLYTLISTLIDRLGNWSADKGDYYTSAEVDTVNTSMKNYVDWVNTTNTGLDTDTFVANYSQFLLNNVSTTNYIGSNNASITNWVSNVYNVTRNNYVSLQNSSIVNWVNDIFYTKTEVNAINTSMKNYVDDTKLSLSGGSMTGNLNLSADINLTMNGGNQIGSNVTCVTIKGSSVTMLIC